MRSRAIFFSALVVFVPTALVYAGIVPECPLSGCRACDLVTLANNVIKFLVQMSVLVAVLSLVFIGFKSIVSGESGAHELQSTFTGIVVGIAIMLVGWLVVDTVLKMLVSTEYNLGPWHEIQCIDNPIAMNPLTEGGGTAVGGGTVPVTARLGTGDCSPEALGGAFGTGAAIMSCIAQGESACQPGRLSATDMTADRNPFSVGLYQINLTQNDDAHNLNMPACTSLNGGRPLNCSQAFSGTNYTARVVNPALYTTCVNAAQNAACNTAAAQKLLATRQSYNHWSAYRACH